MYIKEFAQELVRTEGRHVQEKSSGDNLRATPESPKVKVEAKQQNGQASQEYC